MKKRSLLTISLLLLINISWSDTMESEASIEHTKTNDSLENHLQIIAASIDSLTRLDEEVGKENIDKVIILNKLSRAYVEREPLQAKIYADRGLKLAEELRFKEGISAAYDNLKFLFRSLGDYSKTLVYLNKSLGIKKELLKIYRHDDDPGRLWEATQQIAKTYYEMGLFYEEHGEYREAHDYLFRSRSTESELLELIDNEKSSVSPEIKRQCILDAKRGYISCNNGIGTVYLKKGSALRENGDTAQTNLAYSTAAKIFSESLKISNEIGDKYGIVRLYNYIGLLHYSMGNLSRENGKAEQANSDYSAALENYFSSLDMSSESVNTDETMDTYLNIGHVYHALNKFEDAVKYINKGLALAEESGHNVNMKIAYKALADVSTNIGDYKLVNKYNLLQSTINKTLAKEEMEKALSRLETKYNFENQERIRKENTEAEKVKKEKSEHRFRFLGEIGVLACILLFFAFVFIFTRATLPYNISRTLLFFTTFIIYLFIVNFIGPYAENVTGKEPVFEVAIYSVVAMMMFPLYLFFKSRIVRK